MDLNGNSRVKMKKYTLVLILLLFLVILFVLDIGSQSMETSVISKEPYSPLWFEVVRYLLVSFTICCFLWYSLIFQPDNKIVSVVYLAVGVALFLLLSYSGFYFLHTKFLFSPSLHKFYVTVVSSKLNFLKIGASIVAVLGLLRLSRLCKVS